MNIPLIEPLEARIAPAYETRSYVPPSLPRTEPETPAPDIYSTADLVDPEDVSFDDDGEQFEPAVVERSTSYDPPPRLAKYSAIPALNS